MAGEGLLAMRTAGKKKLETLLVWPPHYRKLPLGDRVSETWTDRQIKMDSKKEKIKIQRRENSTLKG